MDKLELPIGDASFRNIRTSGCYYVDKTPHLWSLAKGGRRYWFLSRPRRFGKSLLVDTLHELFAGIPYSFTPPLRGSRRDKDASPQSLRWGDAEAVGSGASRPPTESAVAFGSSSSTPPQGGSDFAYGSAFSTAHQGGSDVGVARYEGYYASILSTIFSMLNLDIRVEEASVRGRADIVVIYQKQVFVFELKVAYGVDVEAKADQALTQMRDRDYAGKYRTSGRRIHLLAVVFDRQKRNLAMVRVEKA